MSAMSASCYRTALLGLLTSAFLAPHAAAQEPSILYTLSEGGAGDLQGRSVAGPGDVDGDDKVDILVGAPATGSGGAGAARLYSGADGSLLITFTGTAAGDRFGHAVSGARDVNGDSVPDLVVGAPQGTAGIGYVRVISGATGLTLHTFTGDSSFDRLGISVAGVGDLDADGFADVAAGGQQLGTGPGYVRVYSGEWITKTAASQTPITAEVLFEWTGDALGDEFGSSLAALGDVDQDGIFDVVVGAWRDDDLGTNSGSARVFSGATGGVLYTFFGTAAFDAAGVSVAGPGDVNGDGFLDIAVGGDQFGNLFGGVGPGKVWVYSGLSGALLWTRTSPFTDDAFGRSVGAAGDMDGDGNADVLVGVPGHDVVSPTAANAGRVRVISGLSGVPLYDVVGTVASGSLGSAVAGLGDLNADGPADFAGGADAGAGSGDGTALVFISTPPPTLPPPPGPFPTDGRAASSALIVASDLPSPGDDEDPDPLVLLSKTFGNTIECVVGEPTLVGSVSFESSVPNPATGGPAEVVAADLTGEPIPVLDVAVALPSANSVGLFLGSNSPTLASATSFTPPLDTAPFALVAGNFTGSPLRDLAIAGATGISLAENVGGLTFVPAPAGFDAVALLTDLAVGDVDNSGDLDLVATSGKTATSLGLEQGVATVLLNTAGDLAVASTFAGGPGSKAVASTALLDADKDGDLDALLTIHEFAGGPSGEPQGHIELFLWNDPDGPLGPTVGSYVASPWPGFTLNSTLGVHPTKGATADVNNDTWPDAVFTASLNIAHPADDFDGSQPPIEIFVLINNQAGGFTVSTLGTAYAGLAVGPILHDLVPGTAGSGLGDGKVDLVLAWNADEFAGQDPVSGDGKTTAYVTVLSGNGLGGFAEIAPNQFVGPDTPGDGDLGDVNSDAPADGLPGGLDVVVPDTKDNELLTLLGDGSGGVLQANPIASCCVDLETGGTLPPGEMWEGGPKTVRLAKLDGGLTRDALVYNEWNDVGSISPSMDVVASLSVMLGTGLGGFTHNDYVSLLRGGEADAADLNGDGFDDAVVTQRHGVGGPEEVRVLLATGTGMLNQPGHALPAPVGHQLSGGLALVDVDLDGRKDIVTVAETDPGGQLVLLVYENDLDGAGVFPTHLSPLGVPAGPVRSLVIAKLDAGLRPDAAVGFEDGTLLIALGQPSNLFQLQEVFGAAAVQGGGALVAADLDGDLDIDLVSSNDAGAEQSDQAFVRALINDGEAKFYAELYGAYSSTGLQGPLRPMLGDMNSDGAVDVVLSHGDANSVSILASGMNTFQSYGVGKPGSDGLTPILKGKGYTTLGGAVQLKITNAKGGGTGYLLGGAFALPPNNPFFLVQPYLTVFSFPILGPPLPPGSGSFTLPLTLPATKLPPNLITLPVPLYLQVIIREGGPGSPKAYTNGLKFTFIK